METKKTAEMTFGEMARELDRLRGVAATEPRAKRPHAKLSAEVVRSLRANPPRCIAEAARQLGVARSNLSQALSGKKWRHVS